jgi:hypothetical protein
MDTQIKIETGTWKVKVILGVGGLITLIILAFLYRLEVGLILLGLGSVGVIRLGFWAKSKYRLEKLQERQLIAQTEAIELDTKLNLWKVKQEQAIAQKLVYDAFFVERKAGTFVVGNLPYSFYPAASASKQLATNQPLALPAPALDFYQAMSDAQQAYAIVGPQRVGKSILAQHLAQYLTQKSIVCIVVGTKAAKGEWLNCKRYIGNEAVPEALSSLLAEIKGRTENGINSPKLALFLDDWLNSVALDSDLAERFFLEAATRILTVGIVPYFLLQSDSKADWGIKHGAQLKNNFTHLLLNAPRENGQLNYNKLLASIIYPGDKLQYRVTLPVGLPMFGNNEVSIELAEPIAAEPTEQEQRVLELKASGASNNVIARQVYGQHGGKQSQLIKEVLARYGKE